MGWVGRLPTAPTATGGGMTADIQIELKKLASELWDLKNSFERLQMVTFLQITDLYRKLPPGLTPADEEALRRQFGVSEDAVRRMLKCLESDPGVAPRGETNGAK